MRYQIIDILRGTRTTALYSILQKSHYAVESLRRAQEYRLARFLVYLKRFNQYYAKKLQQQSIAQINADPFHTIQSLPVTDKLFITRNKAELFSPMRNRKFQKKRTGGSTGQPLSYYIDLESVSESWAYVLWSWNKLTGYKPGYPYMTVAGSSLGSIGHRLKTKTYQILQNNYTIQANSIDDEMHISKNLIKKAYLLYGYPNAIINFLETKPELFQKHSLQAVFTTSEQLLPHARTFIETQLKIPVYDMYGANDGSLISCECQELKGFHYDPLNCFVEEFVNEEGQTELLLTSIDSVSLPFVRYRVGDIANLGNFGSCRCGSPFPMIHNLHGRNRDLIRLKTGKTIHGFIFNTIIYEFPEIRRYRILQNINYHITFKLEIEDYDAWERSSQKNIFRIKIQSILHDTSFTIERMNLQTTGNQKFKVIESLVD